MNFWRFLDRQWDGLLVLLALLFVIDACEGKTRHGFRLRCGDIIDVRTTPDQDGGAP